MKSKRNVAEVATLLQQRRVIGIARLRTADLTIEACVESARHGLGAVEVPFTVPAAERAIAELRDRLGDRVLVGAGTVRTPSELAAAVAAGAEFLVAPGLNVALADAARRAEVLLVPGVYTASEVDLALSLGLDLLKLFPAYPAGPEYMAALRQPFPTARFVPTGGVGPNNAAALLSAGAAALGMGSSIFPGREIEARGAGVVGPLTRLALEAAGVAA